jgi:hypothetical protein
MSAVTGASILGNTLLDLLNLSGAEVATFGSACNASYTRFYAGDNDVVANSWLVGLSNNAYTINRASNLAGTVVGIGTNAPIIQQGIDVRGDVNFSGDILKNGVVYTPSQWLNTTVGDAPAVYYAGNVGIGGTSTPATALSVVGDISFTGNLLQNGSLFTSGGNGYSNVVLGTSFSYIPIYGSASDGTKTITTDGANVDTRTLYSLQLEAGRYMLSANLLFQYVSGNADTTWATVGLYTSPYAAGATPLSFNTIRGSDTVPVGIITPFYATQLFEAVVEVLENTTYVVVVSGNGLVLKFGGTMDNRLRIVPIAGFGFSDSYNVSAALQVAPVRKTFDVASNTTAFALTTPGYYTAYSSNVDVYLNGTKAVYVSPTLRDYDVTLGYTYCNTDASLVTATNWTVTLQTAAVAGNKVDITVYPQATASTAYAAGYLYQTINTSPTPWNTLVNNGGIRFSGSNVVIDGNLIVGGSVTGSANPSAFVIGTRYDVTSTTGTGGTGINVQWQTAYPLPTFDVPTGGIWTSTSNVGTYRYAGNEIVYNMNAIGTVVQQPNVVAWGSNASTWGNVGMSVPFPVNTASYIDKTVLGDVLVAVTNSNATLTNTFPGYACVDAANANHVLVRYVTGTTDNTLTSLTTGASVKVQGTITYATPQMTGGVPSAFLPPQFQQDTLGRLAINTTGSAPRAQFDVTSTSNLPAFVADQQSGVAGVDAFQIKVAGATKMLVDSVGNVGVGTTAPRKTFDVQGDMVITGLMYDSNLNTVWIPGSTVKWLPVTPAPAFGGVTSMAYSTNQGYYRYVGSEVVYQINVSGVVGAQPALSVDYTLPVPQSAPIDTAGRYLTNTIVGELWLSVVNGASSNTFKAYARTSTTSSTNVTLRYVTGTTDDTLSIITVGSTLTLQGTLTYASPLLNNMNGLPVTYIPAAFAQDQTGKVAFNTGGNAPRAQFDMMGTGANVVGLMVDQQAAAGDILQLRSNAVSKVVVDVNGNVGVGTAAPRAKIDVLGTGANAIAAIVDQQATAGDILQLRSNAVSKVVVDMNGNVGIGTNNPTYNLHVAGNIFGNTLRSASYLYAPYAQFGPGNNIEVPINIISNPTNTLTPRAGSIERDNTNFYGSTTSDFRGIIPCESSYVLKANRLLLDSVATQTFFPVGITLTAETSYRFTANIYMTRVAGVVSHQIRSLIGGTATYTSLRYTVQATVLAAAAASVTTVGTVIGATTITPANAVAAENNSFIFDGILCVNAAGTFNLSWSYSAAPGGAPTVIADSWITLKPIGTNTVAASGNTWA